MEGALVGAAVSFGVFVGFSVFKVRRRKLADDDDEAILGAVRLRTVDLLCLIALVGTDF